MVTWHKKATVTSASSEAGELKHKDSPWLPSPVGADNDSMVRAEKFFSLPWGGLFRDSHTFHRFKTKRLWAVDPWGEPAQWTLPLKSKTNFNTSSRYFSFFLFLFFTEEVHNHVWAKGVKASRASCLMCSSPTGALLHREKCCGENIEIISIDTQMAEN